ncbi:MAG: hypothetical protein KDB03_12925 [Planctomycetales bacterium]|nr:hypothetical protein [Planctomycetales bacterium]
MATVLDMATGVEEVSFALFDEEMLGTLTPEDSSRNACLLGPRLCEMKKLVSEQASKATLKAAVRRELRQARKDILVSSGIALATAIAAICFGLLSVASGVMFLVGSWIAHGLAYRRLALLLLAVTPKW